MPETIKRASWLELFYDLVFVALVAQLTYAVADYHHTLADWLHIVIVGYVIYFAWTGTTVNRNLLDTEGTVDRLFIQVQMVFAFLMSLSILRVFEADFMQFFFGYAMIRLLQVLLMLRLYRLKPEDAPKTYNILQGMLIAAALFMASAFVPLPYAYIVIGMAIVLEILNPLAQGKGNKIRMLNIHHLQERLGLFLILVIGESVLVVAIANTASGAEESMKNAVVVLSGVVMMIAFWWTYFRHLEICGAGNRAKNMIMYLHAHAWLFGSVILVAAALKNLLKHDHLVVTDLMLLTGGVFLFACMSYVIRGQLESKARTGIMRLLVLTAPVVGYLAYHANSVEITVITLTTITVLWAGVDEFLRLRWYNRFN